MSTSGDDSAGRVSMHQLSRLTGKTRENIAKKLIGVPFAEGPKQAKLYAAPAALERIYLGDDQGLENGAPTSEAESRRRLNAKREQEIDLNMEIKRKERIPLSVCEEVNDRVLCNVAGIIKANEGKLLTAETIGDILAELRGLAAGIREWAGGADAE